MTKHIGTPIYECDPWAALAISVLRRAQQDAQRGDLSAVSWLITDGTRLADAIAPESGADMAILELCQEVVGKLDKNKVKARWGIDSY